MDYEGENFQLTEYQIKKTVKAFNYLDKKKKGFLKLDSLGDLLRCCGYNVSLKEIEHIKEMIIENKDKEMTEEKKKETEGNEIIKEGEKREESICVNEKTTLPSVEEPSKEDEETNLTQLLNNLKNYDNFMEIEKKKEELKKQEEEHRSQFSIKEFFRIIQIPSITNEIKPPAVLEAFENFDETGDGKISIRKLRFIFQYLGEPFSNAEFDEFFNWVKTLGSVYKTDHIIYEDLLNELINKDTSL